MPSQNLVLYQDKYYIRVNEENDAIFYFFDYDVRSADINMVFQHFHTFFDLCIPLCPNAVHFIEGIPYEIRAFDIVGISPNRLHKTQYPAGKPCKRVIIPFNLPPQTAGFHNEYELLMKLFDREVPIFRFPPEVQLHLFNKLNEIYRLAAKTDPLRDLMIHQKFVEFLVLLYVHQESSVYSNEAELSDLERKIYAVASYIHTHYTEELSLERLAREFCISSGYLSHRFKEVTGFSVTDYIAFARRREGFIMLVSLKEVLALAEKDAAPSGPSTPRI